MGKGGEVTEGLALIAGDDGRMRRGGGGWRKSNAERWMMEEERKEGESLVPVGV